jgi:hypothetical protein
MNFEWARQEPPPPVQILLATVSFTDNIHCPTRFMIWFIMLRNDTLHINIARLFNHFHSEQQT